MIFRQSGSDEPPSQSNSGRSIEYQLPGPVAPNIGYSDRTPSQLIAVMRPAAPPPPPKTKKSRAKARTKANVTAPSTTATARKRKATRPVTPIPQVAKRHRAVLKQPLAPSDPDYYQGGSSASLDHQVLLSLLTGRLMLLLTSFIGAGTG